MVLDLLRSVIMFNYLQSVSKNRSNVRESDNLHLDPSQTTEGVVTGLSGGISGSTEGSSGGLGRVATINRKLTTMGAVPVDLDGWMRLSINERRRELARTIFNAVQQDNRIGKYFSAVFKSRGAKEDSVVRELIRQHASNASFKWFVKHDDHYHIVHDCTYSGGSCRCFNKFPFERRLRRLISLQTLTAEDYELLIKYHFEEGRRVEVLEVRGTDYSRLFRGLESLQVTRDSSGEASNSGDVEVCTPEDKVLWIINDRYEDTSNDGFSDIQDDKSSRSSGKRGRKRRAANEEKTQEKLEKLILAISKVPLHDFVTTEEFVNSNWRFLNTMSSMFKNAINTVKLKFYNMRLRDYRRHYESLTTLPYWDTTTREEFNSKYLSLQASKKYLLKLLIWQYAPNCMDTDFNITNDAWKGPVMSYCQQLILLLDKQRNKKNTDVYVSPPNAGKTLFMDLIRDYFINCGQMLNWNRNSSFPMQTCGFTRVIFWNEPDYETSVERNLLKLLGGDSMNASIKNQMDVNISKTPVLVTSNTYPFPNSKEFEYRIVKHVWKSAPFLKVVSGKKFHPLSFQYLINETENYYQDDITNYLEKYGDNTIEHNFFEQIDLNSIVYDNVVSDNESE